MDNPDGAFGRVDGKEIRLSLQTTFTCPALLKGVILVATIHSGFTGNPQFQLWRRTTNTSTTYDLVDSRTIAPTRNDLRSEGFYLYMFEMALPILAGDVMGVYQPKSENNVELYYATGQGVNSMSYTYTLNTSSVPVTVDFDNFEVRVGQVLLLTSFTQNDGEYMSE